MYWYYCDSGDFEDGENDEKNVDNDYNDTKNNGHPNNVHKLINAINTFTTNYDYESTDNYDDNDARTTEILPITIIIQQYKKKKNDTTPKKKIYPFFLFPFYYLSLSLRRRKSHNDAFVQKPWETTPSKLHLV